MVLSRLCYPPSFLPMSVTFMSLKGSANSCKHIQIHWEHYLQLLGISGYTDFIEWDMLCVKFLDKQRKHCMLRYTFCSKICLICHNTMQCLPPTVVHITTKNTLRFHQGISFIYFHPILNLPFFC